MPSKKQEKVNKEEKAPKVKKEKVEKKPVKKEVKKEVVKKEPKEKAVAKKVVEKEIKKEDGRYWEAVGRRKTSTARVRLLVKGSKSFLVNKKDIKDYFKNPHLQQTAVSALERMNIEERFMVSVKVVGGGLNSQAEAIRHGISRALVIFNPNFQKRLKKAGFLTRDPRMRERKKFGLKRARRAPQWRKR